MRKRYDGKWVLVTGAAGGMGAELAKAFAAEGAFLFLTDVDLTRLEHIAEPLRAQGTTCFLHAADVSVETQIVQLADAVGARCAKLDVL